jgi:plastocyanin
MPLARPSLTAGVAVLACVALAGCVSSTSAGWTFAPPPTAAPVASASAGASGTPVSGSAAPSGPAADVTITAANIAFEQSSVMAPAGKAFTLLFVNKDSSVPHDVYIKNSGGTDLFEGAIVTGPGQTIYNVPSLPPGSYTFVCSVHSNMTGTMVVQ